MKAEFQSLPAFPENPLTPQSSLQEWERWTQTPMIGFYRYSSIATIQLPTADLEEPKSKSKLNDGMERDSGGLSDNNDSVVLTRKGHKFDPEDEKRTPNQDRVLVLSKRDDNIDDRNNDDNNADWWLGLFDGHGYHGHAVSQYVSLEFARRINKEWENETTTRSKAADSSKSSVMVKDTLKNTFLEINRSIPSFINSAGCTGISVLKRGNSLYISNVGDSLAFVASYNKANNAYSTVKIIYSTSPHKPDTPSERKRIEAAGGRVQDAPFEGASARLIIPVNKFQIVGLAMSRSLGDHDGEKVGLIAEPVTDVLDLTQFDKNQEYIVVAVTDGLVDFGKLSAEEVALSMAKALSSSQSTQKRIILNKEDQKNLRRSPASVSSTEAAAQLISRASQLWDREPGNYRDDISIIAHKLRF